MATWLVVEAVVTARAAWLLAEMEAKARLPAAVGVGRVTVTRLGFHINIDWGHNGEMKHRKALVAVWSRAVCLCEADGWLLYFASRLSSWL